MIITKECKGLQTNTVVLEFSYIVEGSFRDEHKSYDKEIWNHAYGKWKFVPRYYVFSCPLLLITSTHYTCSFISVLSIRIASKDCFDLLIFY